MHTPRALLVGVGLFALHTLSIWIALGAEPHPTWDDAHYLANGARFEQTLASSGLPGVVDGYRTPKPWLFEFLLYPLLSAGITDTRWLVVPSVLAAGGLFWAVMAAGSAMAPGSLAFASALASVAAFRVATFTFATQAEIFLCLGTALGILAGTRRTAGGAAWTMAASAWVLMSGKQSSAIYVVGLVAVFLGMSPLPSRARLRALAFAAVAGGIGILPIYWLNRAELWTYARQASALPGQPFSQFLIEFLRGSIGYPVLAGIAVGLATAWPNASAASRRRTALVATLLALWLAVFGFVLSHNVYRYIVPAIPLVALLPCFLWGRSNAVNGAGGDVGRLAWVGAGLCVVSLVCIQASVHTRWRTPGWYGGRPTLSAGSFCRQPVDEWLRAATRSAPDHITDVWIAGDHQYLNYETVRWQLERQHAPAHQITFLRDPVSDFQRLSTAAPADLIIVGALGGVNLTPPAALVALTATLEADPGWHALGRCEGTLGSVHGFVPAG